MKLTLDANGWTVHATGLDPRTPTEQDIAILRTVPYTNLLLVIHDLPVITAQQYQHFCHRIFDSVQNDNPTNAKRFLPDSNQEIIRVTGKKNDQGEILGLFGMPEYLPWHCNQPGMSLDVRPDCLTLYSVEHCQGSITAFSNSVLALKDLRTATDAPQALLDNLDRLQVHYQYNVDLDLNTKMFDYVGHSGKNKLVVTNKSGQQGILFSNVQTESFWLDDQKLPNDVYQLWLAYLSKFLTQRQYIYAHRWKNNEIIVNCQVLGQHARLPFANIEQRLLWRIMGTRLPFDGTSVPNYLDQPQQLDQVLQA